MLTNDNENTGVGGLLTDTDYLPITMAPPVLPPPQMVGVYADSTAWSSVFKDYVDGGFADPSAEGYSDAQSDARIAVAAPISEIAETLPVLVNTVPEQTASLLKNVKASVVNMLSAELEIFI